MGDYEQKFVQEVFDTNWIAPVGPHIQKFEEALATYNGVKHVAALSSGTAAIHLALIILGVKSGDEVICSSFNFSASANPIRYLGASPVFVDSEPETWNMDPELLQQAIESRIKAGDKPKAIILVHLYGMPAPLDEIMSISRKYEIPVIEDAAEALGSSYKNKKLGSFGDIGIYSFNGNKIITTSGGGALVSNNKAYVEKAKFLATQARDPALHYQHSEIGYNYRLSNVCAAIGCGQMKVIDDRVAKRRANYQYYSERLSPLEQITFLPEPTGYFSNRWLTCITIQPGSKVTHLDICKVLDRENIEARPLWKPLHMQPVFKDALIFTNGVSESLFRSSLCLPSGSSLTEEQKQRVVNTICHLF
jgi:dTDP-4-amino-4,6-dideoxygalactose transaminase